MQLVAYGAQDIYLTGNPQITFFKVVYRRHTNFSMECIEQTIQGASTISSANGQGTVTVSRNGDLVCKVYVCFVKGSESKTGLNACDNLIKNVDLEIGGQLIDRQPLKWMQIWNELTVPESQADNFRHMTGIKQLTLSGEHSNMVQIPLQFWFCRNPGLALPLIALQYHEVKLKFTWGKSQDGIFSDNAGPTSDTPKCQVWADYIYLDTDERRRFAQVSHEYLIEQVQVSSGKVGTTHDLHFNHPVKELIWLNNSILNQQKAKLVLNGHDRFAYQFPEYFQHRQPYDYHTRCPMTHAVPFQNIGPTGGLPRHHVHVPTTTKNENTFTGIAFTTNPANTAIACRDATLPSFCLLNITGTANAGIFAGGSDPYATSAPSFGSIAIGTNHPIIAANDVLKLTFTSVGGGTEVSFFVTVFSYVAAGIILLKNLYHGNPTPPTGIQGYANAAFYREMVPARAPTHWALEPSGYTAFQHYLPTDTNHRLTIENFGGAVTLLESGGAEPTNIAKTFPTSSIFHTTFSGVASTSPSTSQFALTTSDGTGLTPDGKTIKLDSGLAGGFAHVGDFHEITHHDSSLAAHSAGGNDNSRATVKKLAHVVSVSSGVIKYDTQISVNTDATETTDTLSISVVDEAEKHSISVSSLKKHVNVYSFALKPEEHQPSGTCNFSRIDSAKLQFDASVDIDGIYAVNYNVLRIMSGMGGLAYSN